MEINAFLCNQSDEKIATILNLINSVLMSRAKPTLANRCIYYYPMTPLPLDFYAQGYNTVEAFCKDFNVHFYRLDTVDIDRVLFVCSYEFDGKIIPISIPEVAFSRHHYRKRQEEIVAGRKIELETSIVPDSRDCNSYSEFNSLNDEIGASSSSVGKPDFCIQLTPAIEDSAEFLNGKLKFAEVGNGIKNVSLNMNSSVDSSDFDSEVSSNFDYSSIVAFGSQDNEVDQLSSLSYDSDLDESEIRRIGEAQLLKVKIEQDKVLKAVRRKG